MNPADDQYQPLFAANAGKPQRKRKIDDGSGMSGGMKAVYALAALMSVAALFLAIVALTRTDGHHHHHDDDDDGGDGGTTAIGFLQPAVTTGVVGEDFTVDEVCVGENCTTLPLGPICTEGGFKLSLASYTLSTNFSQATYVYELCAPAAGTCRYNATKEQVLKNGAPISCLDTDHCQGKGHNFNDAVYCDRECSVYSFHVLSHMDVAIPLGQCLVPGTEATVSCSTGNASLSDASCSNDGPDFTVVKCDSPTLGNDQCMTMSVTLAGEAGQLGLGLSYVVDKASTNCVATCIAGPSCDRCYEPPPGEDRCLTRTIGFWGTHPWITNNYAEEPVSVCGHEVSCNGPATATTSPSCDVGHCDDIMEALGSIPGEASKADRQYVAMLRQLTAAKLNVLATAALYDEMQFTLCATWTASSTAGSLAMQGIADIIAYCEDTACSATAAAADVAACTAALDEFNNSLDLLGDNGPTPAPFDRPGIDDFGHVSGADATSFTKAQRSGVIIGRNNKGNLCA